MASTSSGRSAGGGDSTDVIKEQVRQDASGVGQSAQQAASQVKDQAVQQAQSLVQQQKSQTTDSLHQVTQALRQAGQNLQNGNTGPAAAVLDAAASRLDGVTSYLEGNSASDIVDDLQSCVRRSPALFLGGAFAIGVLAARFLKSSTPQQSTMYGGQAPYGSSPYGDGHTRSSWHGADNPRYAPEPGSWLDDTYGTDTAGTPAPAGVNDGTLG